jgi:hypothetical protein
MPEEAVDFWPDLGSVKPRTPVLILKQQAALLETEGTYKGYFVHKFILEAPALNYRYEMFKISHDLRLYPVTLESSPESHVLRAPTIFNSEIELVDWLKDILNSSSTRNILGTLLAQVEA